MQKIALLLAALAVFMPTVSGAQISSDLRYGAKGVQVRELQQFLIDQNILVGEPTGNFYSITLQGVKNFQRSVGLPSTGFVGPLTRAEINVRLLAITPASTTPPKAATDAPPATGLSEIELQTQALLKKLAELMATTSGATAVPQTYAAATTPFEFDQSWRSAVVNLFCTDRYGGGLSSGSGVIVDSRGIILTNAHVALDFLFQDWPTPSITECVVRTGSPASPAYKASLVYLPAGYVSDTVKAVPGASDDGFIYGKDDYAILVITGPSTGQIKAPTVFPYLSIDYAAPAVNTPVYLLGYASEYTSYETLQRNLYQLASPASVDAQRMIQGSGKIDTVAFNGNVVGQHGSSGGAVILNGGKLAGLMTFFDKLQGATTADKVLNALTTGYVARDFETDTGVSLTTFLANDPATLVQKFKAGNAVVYQKAFVQYWKSRSITVPGYVE
ncbi:MAG: trypsin-like peptidase domain-containing protein [Candidatus Pacebacteria bacterium]|nr:trypsin-like peptidase domain-containing protein [Candidatus Paceibacterota bacterium]